MKRYKIMFLFLGIFIIGGLILEMKTNTFYELNYLAMGDSISAGYALPDYKKDGIPVEDSFAQSFGEHIGATRIDNLSVSGAKTEDMLLLLENEKYKKAIEKADVITISIGSNDLLGPGIDIIFNSSNEVFRKELMNVIDNNKASKQQKNFLLKQAANEISSEKATKTLQTGFENYKKNFNNIIDKIIGINKKSKIIICGYYNPFKIFVDDNKNQNNFGNVVQNYIDSMNEYLKQNNKNNREYLIADISKMNSDMINANLEEDNINVDPHPNKKGHKYILEQIISKYKKDS